MHEGSPGIGYYLYNKSGWAGEYLHQRHAILPFANSKHELYSTVVDHILLPLDKI